MRKRRNAMLLVLLMVLCVVRVQAAGKVRYSGAEGEFIFEPGSGYSLTDLFTDFKDVMPGDRLEQKILVRNDAEEPVTIQIYLRALGAHEGSEEFLSQLTLRVEQMEQTTLFEAPADQTAQLTDWVLLGTLRAGGELELNVTLEVPVTLDNRYQEQIGYLDWEFRIDQIISADPDDDSPDTGDDANLGGYIAAFVGSAFLLILLLRRKRDEHDET